MAYYDYYYCCCCSYVAITKYAQMSADPSGRGVKGLCLLPFTGWDCGFKSLRRLECLSLVSVVCCHLEVSALGWSFVHKIPTD